MVERPREVTISGIAVIILGMLLLVDSYFLYIAEYTRPDFSDFGEAAPDLEEFWEKTRSPVTSYGSAGLGLIVVVTGLFVLKGANWARWLAVFFAVLILFSIVTGPSISTIWDLLALPLKIIISLIVIYYLQINKNWKPFFKKDGSPSPKKEEPVIRRSNRRFHSDTKFE